MNVSNHVQVGIPGRGTSLKDEIERRFHLLCEQEGRRGTIGFVPVDKVRLLAVQMEYLQRRLNRLGAWSNITAVSIGIFYHESEILDIPSRWISRPPEDALWNQYAHAYTKLNQLLNRISVQLEEEFGGVSEQATVSGLVGKISHVNDYFPVCVSHRAFAESARIGWRGKHGLIVTPEVGPAVRFATVFIPHLLPIDDRHLIGWRLQRLFRGVSYLAPRQRVQGKMPSSIEDSRSG